eukprot:1050495-Rhodomonas_salina.1
MGEGREPDGDDDSRAEQAPVRGVGGEWDQQGGAEEGVRQDPCHNWGGCVGPAVCWVTMTGGRYAGYWGE